MKKYNIKKYIFNIYNLPAILITILNVVVAFNDIQMFTNTAILLMICFWISGILLFKKYNFGSLIAIISIIIFLIESINSNNNFVDPYYIPSLLILFYVICELYIFYKKAKNKKTKWFMTIIIIFITIISLVFSIVDYNLVKNDKMPIFMIKVIDSYESEYIGLGYAMTLTNEIHEPYTAFLYESVYFRSWINLFQISNSSIKYNDDVNFIEIEPSGNNNLKLLVQNDEFDLYGLETENIIINLNENEWYEINDYFDIYTRSGFIGLLEIYNTSVERYKDGGTALYEMHQVNVLVCNTSEGNYDIYLGNNNLKYEEDYCK